MKQRVAIFLCLLSSPVWADRPEIGGHQNTYERENATVVRNKKYFKPGRVELTGVLGVVPYDSTYNTFTAGGRLTWHIGDHYGWEVVDFMMPFSSVTSWTTNLASNSTSQLVDLQTVKPGMTVGSHLLVSPFYGKIRFFGSAVVHLDIYLVAGLGMANTSTLRYAYSASSPNGYSETLIRSGWDPSIDYGVGFKFFLGRGMSLQIDLRNYMTYSQLYSVRTFYSNFIVNGGLSLYLPFFG